jgi:uncharacterized membrane protein YbaN (DUF454 family)
MKRLQQQAAHLFQTAQTRPEKGEPNVRGWEKKDRMPAVSRVRRYVVTTIVMVVLYGICMLALWRYLSSATSPEPKLIFAGIGLLIVCQGIVGLISGTMPTKNGMVNRDERPVSFWTLPQSGGVQKDAWTNLLDASYSSFSRLE